MWRIKNEMEKIHVVKTWLAKEKESNSSWMNIVVCQAVEKQDQKMSNR